MKMFPIYMAMGMTYEEYWHGPAWLVRAYREAFEIKQRREEWARHRQGAYFLQALGVVLQGFNKDKTHKEKYPEEPWPVTEEEAREQQERREEANYEKSLAMMRDRIKREREKRMEAEQEQEVNGDGDD